MSIRKMHLFAILLSSATPPVHAQFSGGSASSSVVGDQYGGPTRQQLEAANVAAREAAAQAAAITQAEFEAGYAAHLRGDEATAMIKYRRACIDGRHATSCANIGTNYHGGRGVPENLREAAAWYQRALDIDPTNTVATGNLQLVNGLIHQREGNYASALSQFLQGCSLRNSYSCMNAGVIYHNGWGLAANLSEAVILYQRALTYDSSNAFARKNLQTAQLTLNRQAATSARPAVPLTNSAPATRSNDASSKPATARQAQLLSNAIWQDSQSWIVNRFDNGSVSDVRITSVNGSTTTATGRYTFNQGQQGWAAVQIQGGQVQCIQFWDTGTCAPVRTAARIPTRPTTSTDEDDYNRRAAEWRRQDCLSRNIVTPNVCNW